MKKILEKNLPIIVLLAFSILFHFLFLNYPSEAVFDEIYFGKFVSAYFSHEYYFDIHPPLGKLMIAGFIDIFGLNPYFNLSHIGQEFMFNKPIVFRFMPALFGAFFVLVIYLLVLKAGLSRKAAFLAGSLVVFDIALLAQSKFILVDIFLLFFGFLSLYFLVAYNEKKKLVHFVLAVVFSTLALSIKWTGLLFLGLVGLSALIDFIRNFRARYIMPRLLILAIISLAIYFSVFAIHFNALYKPGPGDAFISEEFKKIPSPSLWQKFIELNKTMYNANAHLTATHPDGSKWFQWPFSNKPIWYWAKSSGGEVGNIYLFGNPLVWVSVIFAVLLGLTLLFTRMNFIFYFAMLGYFANLLPYIFITRVAFLYHYLPSLVFGILLIAVLYDRFLADSKSKLAPVFYFIFIFCLVLSFIILSPLSYGFLISPETNEIYSDFINLIKT